MALTIFPSCPRKPGAALSGHFEAEQTREHNSTQPNPHDVKGVGQ